MKKREIILTIDVDWAPDEMIADTLQLIEDYGVVATFFCTHKTDLLINSKNHEMGIHPNFISLLEGKSTKSKEQLVDELLEIYPDAQGVRAHGLLQSSALMSLYLQRGLKYDCNIFMPLMPITTFVCDEYNGFKRCAYNFEDDILYKTNKKLEFNLNNFEDSSIIILDFHPFLIYNNISSHDEYDNLKKHYMDVETLNKMRDLKKTGIRNVFLQALEVLSKEGSSTLKENIL